MIKYCACCGTEVFYRRPGTFIVEAHGVPIEYDYYHFNCYINPIDSMKYEGKDYE